MARARTVGVVSPGAMGSAVGHALREAGVRVVATLDRRSERTAGLARRAEIECLADLAAVVREADVILSIAPPAAAETIAADVGRAAKQAGAHPLFVELNAIAPASVRRIAAELDLDVVDGAISGPPPWQSGTTRIYLAGPRAGDVATLPMAGVDVIVVGDELGAASAVKMSTASVYKGTTAVLAQALLTAQANGVLEHVLSDLRESLPELLDDVERSIARAATKAERYVGEMLEIAATQEAAGLPAGLFGGMAEVYAALSLRPLARQAPEDVPRDLSLEDVLSQLQPLE